MTLSLALGWSDNPGMILAPFPPSKSDWHMTQTRTMRAFPGLFAAIENEAKKTSSRMRPIKKKQKERGREDTNACP